MAAARLKCYSLDKCNKMIQCGTSRAAGFICAYTPVKTGSCASGARVKGLFPPAGNPTDQLRTTTHFVRTALSVWPCVTLPPAGPYCCDVQSVVVRLVLVVLYLFFPPFGVFFFMFSCSVHGCMCTVECE